MIIIVNDCLRVDLVCAEERGRASLRGETVARVYMYYSGRFRSVHPLMITWNHCTRAPMCHTKPPKRVAFGILVSAERAILLAYESCVGTDAAATAQILIFQSHVNTSPKVSRLRYA